MALVAGASAPQRATIIVAQQVGLSIRSQAADCQGPAGIPVLELERMLAKAQLIKPSKKKDVVQIGSTVVVKQDGEKSETYTIVGVAEANPKDGLISNESPLGQALLDQAVGDEIDVQAPAGTLSFRIEKIK